MIVARIAPREDIDRVLFDDDIYDRTTDDNCPPKEDVNIPYDLALYVGGYVNGRIASLYIVHGDKMHFMVLKGCRAHARELLEESIRFHPQRVYCEIPALYMSVINFAKKNGFTETKINKNKHLKNGKLYNIHTLVKGE